MAGKTDKLPDLAGIERGLKDFQLRTAKAAFHHLYTRKHSTHRFLVADEVGLGKTLIARSVIARTLHHLWDRVPRIDVIYICSNADIARQNIRRLNVLGEEGKVLPTRITLLPLMLGDLNRQRINFISFTPGTSFDLKSNLGIARERMLLYCLLERIWNFSGTAPKNVFQGSVETGRFRTNLKHFARDNPIDRSLSRAFRKALMARIQEQRTAGEQTLRQRFDWLCQRFRRSDSPLNREARQERSAFIGELRGLLAQTCIRMLEPDLIILDEFQRFKSLLSTDSDASALARALFEYSDETTAVRMLLLSATPYKMYTLSGESDEEDHYRDFLDTLRFLFRDEKRVERFSSLLQAYRLELLRFNENSLERLESLKNRIERSLRQVMARTERLAATDDRAGMLTEMPPREVELLPGDVLAYVELQRIANELGMPGTIEYWKSSSYLLNFMEDYKLKHKLHAALERGEAGDALNRALANARHLLLSWREVENYERLDPRNARLRGLFSQVVETRMWQLLWLPPSLPYYALEGPFRDHDCRRLTKRLIFSNWKVVPKVISTLLSYEAERRSVTLHEPDARNTEEARARRSHNLLRISTSRNRLTGMPVLALLYPSITLATRYDPVQRIRRHLRGEPLSLGHLKALLQEEISQDLQALRHPAGTGETRSDEQWYWAAPILLDLHHYPDASEAWFGQPNLEEAWAPEETRGDDAWHEHLERMRLLIDGELPLGPPPPDLASVLTLFVLGGPTVCALRALAGATDTDPSKSVATRNAAGRIGWAFRSLYNRPEVTALLRGLKPTEPYWQRVLEYGAEGCLQSVLDEYVHVLRNSLGLVGEEPEDTAEDLTEVLQGVLTLRSSVLTVDDIRTDGSGGTEVHTQRLPSRFAMPFGQGRDEESGDSAASRGQKVREAFNSPFWPFVLTSTSIGQEGLDFHWYCHAIVHWNLPANPVDLEQREGRVHRYLGHAVRKNLAKRFGLSALAKAHSAPWEKVLEMARSSRAAHENDLVPYWIYPIENGARIERHVPSLPLTRDRELLEALRRSLAVYRLVFGQPRQDDLVEYLIRYIPEEKLEALMERLRIDLSPG